MPSNIVSPRSVVSLASSLDRNFEKNENVVNFIIFNLIFISPHKIPGD